MHQDLLVPFRTYKQQSEPVFNNQTWVFGQYDRNEAPGLKLRCPGEKRLSGREDGVKQG